MTNTCSRRLFVPLVVAGSLLWVALIIVGDVLAGERLVGSDLLPLSVGCGEPGPAALSPIGARPGPCTVLVALNPAPRRRNHHDKQYADQ